MPVCCRCNGSGRCRSCACVKSGRPCVDCLPSRKGNCCNNAHTSTSSTSSTTTPALTTDNGNLPSSSPSADTSDTVNLHVTRELLTSHPSLSSGAILDDVTTDAPNPSPVDEIRTLPSFKPTQSMTASWGDLSGEEFTKAIDDAYAQVIHWRPNLFKIPSGACGKQLVTELTCLFNAFALDSEMESIALKAAMTLPALMLQKTHAKSKTRDHLSPTQIESLEGRRHREPSHRRKSSTEITCQLSTIPQRYNR